MIKDNFPFRFLFGLSWWFSWLNWLVVLLDGIESIFHELHLINLYPLEFLHLFHHSKLDFVHAIYFVFKIKNIAWKYICLLQVPLLRWRLLVATRRWLDSLRRHNLVFFCWSFMVWRQISIWRRKSVSLLLRWFFPWTRRLNVVKHDCLWWSLLFLLNSDISIGRVPSGTRLRFQYSIWGNFIINVLDCCCLVRIRFRHEYLDIFILRFKETSILWPFKYRLLLLSTRFSMNLRSIDDRTRHRRVSHHLLFSCSCYWLWLLWLFNLRCRNYGNRLFPFFKLGCPCSSCRWFLSGWFRFIFSNGDIRVNLLKRIYDFQRAFSNWFKLIWLAHLNYIIDFKSERHHNFF